MYIVWAVVIILAGIAVMVGGFFYAAKFDKQQKMAKELMSKGDDQLNRQNLMQERSEQILQRQEQVVANWEGIVERLDIVLSKIEHGRFTSHS